MQAITRAMNSTLTAMRSIQGVELGPEFAAAAADVRLAETAIDRMNRELQETPAATQAATGGFTLMKGLAVNALTSIARAAQNAVGDVINLTDSLTSSAARLNLIAGEGESVSEIQEDIFRAAQRSRGEYLAMVSTVSKLGITASAAFSDTREIVAFTELLNKNFVVAGASASEMTNATYQLNQAMASGRLQGDEFRSILENAPLLAQAIEGYVKELGYADMSLKEMSSQGLITSDVIKAALFSTAEEVNAKFSEMPMTIGQIGTHAANALLRAFQPALQAVGEGARYIYDNWEQVAPVFYGVAGGITAAAAAWGIYTAAQWIATGAAQAFFAALLTNPLMWIALVIGVVIGMIYKWVQAVGGVEIAWAIAVDAIMTKADQLEIGITPAIHGFRNLMDQGDLAIAKFKVGIINHMDDMKVGVLTILQNMVNGSIDIINSLISSVSNIPGISIDAIEHVTFAATAAAESEAAKQSRAADIAMKEADVTARAAERESALTQMKYSADISHALRQTQIALKRAEAISAQEADPLAGLTTGSGAGAALKTKEQGEIKIDGEDLKLLLDISTLRFQAHYETLAPQVSVGVVTINENADADYFINTLADRIEESSESSLTVGG